MTYGHALDSLRRYMVKENMVTGITDVCMEEFRHKHMNLFKPMPTKQTLVEAELKALHDREAEMAAQGELEYETSSDESWRHLTSFAIPSHGKMNMYDIGTKLFLKWDRSVVSCRITVYGMHRKVLPWSFALKMMIEHVYGEWAAVHCNEDQGRSWILDTAFFRLTDGTTTLICHIPDRLYQRAENLDLQFAF